MKAILNYLFDHNYLSRDKAREVLTNIAQNKYNECEIAAFLSVFILRSIKVEELAGFREALLDLCVKIDLSDFEPIDLCGTGGDNKNTFNISTIASFVVAGAGGNVAKHGNYGVSSGCGSSNVMEYLGYRFTNDEEQLRREMSEAGICFLHAPLFHPALKNVAPIRKKLGVKTFFNMTGPMVNPASPKYQMIGVFNLEVARLYHYLYQKTNNRYIILHSLDGYDEISLTGPFKLTGKDFETIYEPEELHFKRVTPKDIEGGDTVEKAAGILSEVLKGKGTEAQNNVVLANAAIGLKTIHQDKTIPECIEMAKDSLYNKKAYNVLQTLLAVNEGVTT